MSFKDQIDMHALPGHIAITMDGNGRWAKERGKIRTFGHKHGVAAVRDTTEGAAEIGIKYLTLYAFSTENWSRPKFEIDALMELLIHTIGKETKTLNDNNIRLQAIGNINSLPKSCIRELNKAIDETKNNSRMTLVLALSYSSRWEITEAAKKIAKLAEEGKIKSEDVNEELFISQLTTASIPDPELLIRTSGEHRISNYLLWQIAYAELYFTEKLWPDFRREDLFEAIVDFQKEKGGLAESIQKNRQNNMLENKNSKFKIRSLKLSNWRMLFLLLIIVSSNKLQAQVQLGGEENEIDYSNPKEYTIAGITVSGIKYLDENVLKTLSGLAVGDKLKIPGEKISKAIENLWKQNLLADVKIEYTKIEGENIFLNIAMVERPRLSKFSFTGVSKSEANKLREKINLVSGKIVNENLLKVTSYEVKDYFTDKGYLNTEVKIDVTDDSIPVNSQTLVINIQKNERTKIHDIHIEGNTAFTEGKIRHLMKDTKQKRWYTIFTSSKFIEENFEKDKKRITDKYQEMGYRDAKVAFDTVYSFNKNMVNVDLRIDEGNKYYFRNITWVGNTKYRSGQLDSLLGIKKGDIYNQKRLDEGLNMSASGRDVSSLYMDDGYLFFQINPVEIQVEHDSIDIEMRMYEGKQAVINKITVTGNTKTNDKVIMREIYTKPGQLFSRQDVIRTQRELSQLGYFDPEKLGVNPKPNPTDGTVDIDYVVEEKPSDQIELSGGWGAGQVVGTLGVTFNNFSARNIFKKGNWTPLPSGDGQKLSVRFQTNGTYYQSYNASFTEPWLGGKKPNSLSVSFFHSLQTNGQPSHSELRQSISIKGVSVGLGKRLKFPDDFFSIFYEASYQYYDLNHYQTTFLFNDGFSNNLNFTVALSRNSVNQPIYPSGGTSMSLSVELTPPYSLINNINYKIATDQVKYRYIEYHKWKFSSSWFTPLVGKKLIVASKVSFGFLGYYNADIGQSPFERFYLGGDGLSGYSLDGREIIAHRGYGNGQLSPSVGASIYNKYTMEIRYPVSLNPNATIYGMGFLEAGNSWARFRDYNPFAVKRAAGFGVRIFLPMFGLLGLDWGYGFDRTIYDPLNATHHGPEFQFTLGQQF